MIRGPPTSTLFPYTTLFRSLSPDRCGHCLSGRTAEKHAATGETRHGKVAPSMKRLKPQIVAALVGLYPARWKREYGDEFRDVLMRQPLEAVAVLDAVWNAMGQQVRNGEPWVIVGRSEEHTSELQSLRHLVCRLLLA